MNDVLRLRQVRAERRAFVGGVLLRWWRRRWRQLLVLVMVLLLLLLLELLKPQILLDIPNLVCFGGTRHFLLHARVQVVPTTSANDGAEDKAGAMTRRGGEDVDGPCSQIIGHRAAMWTLIEPVGVWALPCVSDAEVGARPSGRRVGLLARGPSDSCTNSLAKLCRAPPPLP